MMPLRWAASRASAICAASFSAWVKRQRSFDGSALDVLHHQVVRADVVERADVRVVEGGDGTGFALEALGELVFGDLDGDAALEACVARFVNLAHAPDADGSNDLIRAETSAPSERHGGLL